jgi:hypothetical protein
MLAAGRRRVFVGPVLIVFFFFQKKKQNVLYRIAVYKSLYPELGQADSKAYVGLGACPKDTTSLVASIHCIYYIYIPIIYS